MTGEPSRLRRDLDPMPNGVRDALDAAGLVDAYARRPPSLTILLEA